MTQVNSDAAGQVAGEQPQGDPKPDTAEYNVQVALQNPGNIPNKFKRDDGTVDVDALTQSYRELERRQSGQEPQQSQQPEGETPPNAADTLNQPKEGEKPKAEEQTQESAEDILSSEKPDDSKIDWDAVRNGTVTKEQLDKWGVPHDVAAQFAAGRQAAQQAALKAAAEVVGGEQELASTLKWARDNLSQQEWNSLRESAKGPQGKTILMGLHAQRLAASPKEEGKGMVQPDDGGVPVDNPGSVQPYASQAEMHADMDERDSAGNRKYEYDSAKQKQVAKRIWVTQGKDPREFEKKWSQSQSMAQDY